MTRVLSSACIVLLWLGLSDVAWAGGGKPSIAILGLEVTDSGTGIDPETTKAAKEITAALRDRAKVGTGVYALVPNGDKELIDQKLLNNCDTEAAPCMATIGGELGADALMFGKIERVSQNGQTLYKVSLKLLNVNRKQVASSTVEMLPVADASGVRLSTHARAWFAKLAGGSSGGSIIVKTNIDRGTVLIDNEMKGTLSSGTLAITGVGEGRHVLAIEAKDHQRYEAAITVRNGETLSHSASLVEMPKLVAKPQVQPPSEAISTEGTLTAKPKSNVWKPVFYTTTVAGAGALAYTLWQWKLSNDEADKVLGPEMLGPEDCPRAEITKACDHHRRHVIGVVASSVLGAAAIGSFVMAYVRDGGRSETATARGKRKRREFAVTPVVTPGGGGATLRFDW
jgi:hypothetical protein